MEGGNFSVHWLHHFSSRSQSQMLVVKKYFSTGFIIVIHEIAREWNPSL